MSRLRLGGPAAIPVALTVAVLLRVALGLHFNVAPGLAGGEVQRGFEFYGQMADGLLTDRGMSWVFYESLGEKFANRAPLYPLLLAGVRSVAGTPGIVACILAQAVVGGLACRLPGLLAARWGGRRADLTAVWITALWPYWAVTDTGMVEHVLFAPLVGATVLVVLRAMDTGTSARAVGAGLLAGFTCLARLTFGLALPFLAVLMLVRTRSLRPALLFTLGVVVVLTPWVLRNHAVVGSYTVGTDGARALWLGSHPALFEYYPAHSVDRSEQRILRRLDVAERAELRGHAADEVAQAGVFRQWALERHAAAPGAVAWGSLRKVAALWSPVYNPLQLGESQRDLPKLVVFGLSIGVLAFGVGWCSLRSPAFRLDAPVLVAVALGFSLAAGAFWGQSRYLAPLHGVGIAAVATWMGSRRDGAGSLAA